MISKHAVEPVALTVHSLSTPDLAEPVAAAQRRTTLGRARMLLVLLVCAAPVVASYFTYYVLRPEGRSNYGELIQPTRSMPALPLQTLDGQPRAAATLRGPWLLVVVGDSNCAAACEQRLYFQRQLREMLGRDRDRLEKIWFVTDGGTPSSALMQATQVPVPVTTLRVSREALAAWLAPAAGQALEDHLFLVDPMGEWMMRLPPNPDPKKVKRDLDRVMRASASWHLPAR